tara:strand:+ start:1579 stop:2004 length:426 start_codon:yes stop_codon:yes gene_type:complete
LRSALADTRLASVDPRHDLGFLQGAWECHHVFVGSAMQLARLASRMRLEEAIAALVVKDGMTVIGCGCLSSGSCEGQSSCGYGGQRYGVCEGQPDSGGCEGQSAYEERYEGQPDGVYEGQSDCDWGKLYLDFSFSFFVFYR